jgi:hypothetical protein
MMSSLHPLGLYSIPGQWLSAQVQVEDSWFLLGATWKVQGELKHQHPWNSMATWGIRFSTSNIHQYPAFSMRHNRMCIYNIISYIHNYMSILCINAYYTCLCYNQKYEIGPSKIEDDLLGGFTLTIFGIRDMDGYCLFSKAIPFTIIWNTIGQFDNPIYT